MRSPALAWPCPTSTTRQGPPIPMTPTRTAAYGVRLAELQQRSAATDHQAAADLAQLHQSGAALADAMAALAVALEVAAHG